MAINSPRGNRKTPLFARMAAEFDPLNWLTNKLDIQAEVSAAKLKKCLFVFLLVLIYIFFQNNIETLFRDISKAEREIKEKRAAFISHNAAYRFKSKHSQISISLEERGLHRNIEPPIKIVAEN